jgi:FkbM family methyltransferase
MSRLAQRIADRVLREAGLFRTINRNTVFEIGGRKFVVPTLNGCRANPSEEWMLAVLRRLFGLREGAVVDVGVNLGQTLLKVRALDPARRYVGFEPNPTCVDYVERLIAANRLENCTVVPVGLAREPGILTLDLFGDHAADSSASLIPDFRPSQRVSARKIVAVLSSAQLPPETIPAGTAVVKIDVEGAELDVIEALLPVLQPDRPYNVMEILPCYTEKRADRIERQAAIERHLRELDYKLYRISHHDDRFSGLREIDTIGIHSDMELCDYIAAPAKFSAQLTDSQ